MRSSIEASERRSSARPLRSVTRAEATSSMISSKVERIRQRGSRGGHVTDGAEANGVFFGHFPIAVREVVALSQQNSIALDAYALVRKVKVGNVNLFVHNVLPNIHFRPVAQRKDTEVFALVLAAVKQVPQFGALVFGVPLSKLVAVRKNRSLARAFSSSRRAPPKAASNFPFSKASSRLTVCKRMRLASVPFLPPPFRV